MTASFRTSQTVSALDPSKPHIVLVGLPGAGKSTVGALLGQKLSRTFLDFDAEIERREAMTIPQIFGERGEPAFRELERKLTMELKDLGNMVLSPGGGWITDTEAVSMLRPPAMLVYLRARPETALKRLGGAAGARPLLNKPDPLGELNKLFEARKLAYQAADLEISTELYNPEQVTQEIIKKVGVGK
ncbi:MAG TPA: shikimate kinase [Gemmatimonadaceae bacterium]|nr:shikimate kinase [Gemmatimonadaceae bacterium]